MLTDGLTGGWRLNETAGSPRADVLGVATMVETGGTVPGAVGRSGGAANFTGDQHYLLYNTAALAKNTSLTMACWVYWVPGGTQANYTLFCQGTGTPARQSIMISGITGQPKFAVSGGTVDDGVPAPNRWTHLVLVYDATGNNGTGAYTTYQDGVQVGQHNTAANFVVSAVAIGNQTNGGGITPATALVDEAYIWSRALSAIEVYALYKSGNNGQSYPFIADGKSA